MVFPVVMYGCELDCEESWALKNWCFWTVVWRRFSRVPWTAKRSNQSILKEISPEYSLEGLMLNSNLQYFGHLMQRVDSLKKTLILGGIRGKRIRDDRGWDVWMASPTRWTWVWVNSGSWWWTGRPGVLWFMGSQRVGHDWAIELSWTLAHQAPLSMGSQRVRLDLATQWQERQWNQDVINYYGREGVIGQGTSVGGLVDLRDHMVFLNSEGISPWNHFMAFSLIPHTSKQNS